MAKKYVCDKCGRKYLDWGAEKLGFKCSCEDDAVLVLIGAPPQQPSKPALTKKIKVAATAAPELSDAEEVDLDVDVDIDSDADDDSDADADVLVAAEGDDA